MQTEEACLVTFIISSCPASTLSPGDKRHNFKLRGSVGPIINLLEDVKNLRKNICQKGKYL